MQLELRESEIPQHLIDFFEPVHRPRLASKQWVAIPWMLGMALQADGWWLRSPIIWAKGLSFCETYSGSVMPESVRDRPTTSYEYLLLLTKKARYFYDADAVREEHKEPWRSDTIEDRRMAKGGDGLSFKGWDYEKRLYNPAGRNLRSVWAINPHPFPDAHFATFPPALVEPCIKAGTSERGCCPECGKGWERVTEKSRTFESGSGKAGNLPIGKSGPELQGGGQTLDVRRGPCLQTRTLGWRPGCSHGHDPIPCLVLDPFVGSGTTVMVALRLGRRALGIDLSEEYCRMARKRIIADNPMFNGPGEAT